MHLITVLLGFTLAMLFRIKAYISCESCERLHLFFLFVVAVVCS